jgi:hypothetical protein
VPSRPKHKKEDKPLSPVLVGVVIPLVAALILVGGSALVSYIGRSPSGSAPVESLSSPSSATAQTPGSPFDTSHSPAPISLPSQTPAPTGTSSSKPRPVHHWHVHSPTSTAPIPQRAPASPFPLGFSIDPAVQQGLLFSSLSWTPNVTRGGQAVVQGCRISWELYAGALSIYAGTSSCGGTSFLPFPLLPGVYQLVGQATLDSGQQASASVGVQVG